jgi:hypothetical protein
VKCKNCGDEIRRVQPGDGIDPRDFEWVHVYRLSGGGEIANPICDITLTAEPRETTEENDGN